MVVQHFPVATPPPPTVLIVEDDQDTRELYETIFNIEGFWVAQATSAEAAVDQAAHLQPDVIITDVGLANGCDGVALASRLHAFPRTANVPVIAVTGRNLKELSPQAEFSEILQKPVSPNELVAATRRVLAASAVLRQRGENTWEPARLLPGS